MKRETMAQRVQYILEDDLDGSPAAESVNFALDGVTYVIDLSEENAEKLREDFGQWIGHARRSGGRRNVRGGRSAAKRNNTSDMRNWARENGFKVSDRGRIPASVQEAYERAMG